MRLFMNHLLFTRERSINSIFPSTGATIFALSTFSHDAGARSENPAAVCLISPELSTSSSTHDELLPKQPANKIVQEKRRKKRKREDIFLPKRNIEGDNHC